MSFSASLPKVWGWLNLVLRRRGVWSSPTATVVLMGWDSVIRRGVAFWKCVCSRSGARGSWLQFTACSHLPPLCWSRVGAARKERGGWEEAFHLGMLLAAKRLFRGQNLGLCPLAGSKAGQGQREQPEPQQGGTVAKKQRRSRA